MGEAMPGIELARRFYVEVVAPLVDVPHAAARVGWGSDVLGYDDARSTDHGWGPHLHLFVAPDAVPSTIARIDDRLPDEFAGWPVRFGWDAVTERHWVEVTTVHAFVADRLGADPRDEFTSVDWLLLPQQRLLEVTAGAVFHDSVGDLTALRAALGWYPDDVWRWMVACQWHRVAQEEAFVARTAQVGDDLGSVVIAARLARDAMRLAFLLERRYAPYTKWLGTAFTRLDAATEVEPQLRRALAAKTIDGRTDALNRAFEALARRSNALGLTDAVDPTARPFHDRPWLVLDADRFTRAWLATVGDPALHALPLVGALDQFVDNTDLVERPALASERLRALLT